MKNWIVSLFCLLGSVLAAGPLAAEVAREVDYEYYDVPAVDWNKLHVEVFSRSPITGGGKKYAGHANWNLEYSYKTTQPTIGVCRPQNLAVTSRCVITLPRLKGGDRALHLAFNSYLAKLGDHERRHCQIAVNYGEAFESWFRTLGDQKCETLTARIKSKYDQVMEECRSEQKRYDHQTQHGRYEGINLRQSLRELGIAGSDQNWGAPKSGLVSLDTDPDDGQDVSGFHQGPDGVWRNY
jgi:Predicted secreted Zn-dependent protease